MPTEAVRVTFGGLAATWLSQTRMCECAKGAFRKPLDLAAIPWQKRTVGQTAPNIPACRQKARAFLSFGGNYAGFHSLKLSFMRRYLDLSLEI